MDYLSYWKLHRKPFLFPQGDEFFSGVPQREAIAGLGYFVSTDEDSALLISDTGQGLSWLLSHVEQMRGFGDFATELIITRGDQNNRQAVLDDFASRLGFGAISNDLRSQIDATIEKNRQQGVRLVWMIDSCQASAIEVATEFIAAHDNVSVVFSTDSTRLIQTITQIGKVPMRIDLATLSLEDTCDYLKYCLDRSGGDEAIVSDNVAVRLHEITDGVIGRLAVAAESSLAIAANHRLDSVTPAVVEAFAERQRQSA